MATYINTPTSANQPDSTSNNFLIGGMIVVGLIILFMIFGNPAARQSAQLEGDAPNSEVNVQAPEVNIPAPQVNVPAPQVVVQTQTDTTPTPAPSPSPSASPTSTP